jgi:hypothetical protein
MVNLPTAGIDYHVPFGGRRRVQLRPAGAGHLRERLLYGDKNRVHGLNTALTIERLTIARRVIRI